MHFQDAFQSLVRRNVRRLAYKSLIYSPVCQQQCDERLCNIWDARDLPVATEEILSLSGSLPKFIFMQLDGRLKILAIQKSRSPA